MAECPDVERFRRLMAARAADGPLPADLVAWLGELLPRLAALATSDARSTPAERARLRLGAEVDRWMVHRGLTPRTIAAPRRTVQRALGAANITIDAAADVADALGCELLIRFAPREAAGR